MTPPPLLLLLLSLLTSPALSDELKQNGENCDCFVTNGTSAGYFTYHRFHDFRNVHTNYTRAPPPIIGSADADANFAPTSAFFGDESGWIGDWDIQSWNNSESLAPDNYKTGDATVYMQNSAGNVYIEPNTDPNTTHATHLTLRTARLPTYQSAAEIDSTRANYQHLSIRLLARVLGPPGACAGIFTYRAAADAQKVQEIDIELLTAGPRTAVQYTNQPSRDAAGAPIPDATTNATPAADWSRWTVHRLDWMADASTWYVDGAETARIARNVPRAPSRLILNLWGDGGEWTGNMSVGAEALLQVQWIEVAFNTSGAFVPKGQAKRALEGAANAGGGLVRRAGHGACRVVCGVDEARDVGTPALRAQPSTAARAWLPSGALSSVLGLVAWWLL